MTVVPSDSNMLPEVRRFLDDLKRQAKLLQTQIDALATFPGFASQAEAEAGTSETVVMNPLRTAQAIAALNPFAFYLHVRDEKSTSTDGGDFLSGAWRTRTLNTVVTNRITGASLSSNEITLPAGRFLIRASAPAFGVSRHQARLFDVTGAATLMSGTSERGLTNGVNEEQTRSWLEGEFTLSSSSNIRIEHQSLSNNNGDGMGLATTFGAVEVYTDAHIWKVA